MTAKAARESCSFFLARLQIEIARLRSVPFPGHDTGPRQYLNLVSGFIDTGRNYLQESTRPGISASDELAAIRAAEMFGNTAYQFAQHIAGADASQIPHQIVAPFRRIVDELGIKNTIFFRSEHLPNYELGTFDFANFPAVPHASETLKTAYKNLTLPILRVTVPGHSMGMLPHFAVVGHELGHAIQNNFFPDPAALTGDEASFWARLKQRLQATNTPFNNDAILLSATVISNWMNELKADAIGYLLGGPSFFFALCGFIQLSSQTYGLGETHPPTDLRRKLLLDHLSSGTPSFCDVFKSKTGQEITETVNSPGIPVCPGPDDLFNEFNPRVGPLKASIWTEAIPFAAAMGPHIYSAAQAWMYANCPALIYKPEHLSADLDDHLEPLCNLVPPIESRRNGTTTAASLAAILNVGWTALLTKLDQIAEPSGDYGDTTSRRMERLHELLLKGAELAEAKRLWEENV